MLKELTVRTNGEDVIEAMFKSKRTKELTNPDQADTEELDGLGDPDEDLDETWMEDLEEDEDRPLASNAG